MWTGLSVNKEPICRHHHSFSLSLSLSLINIKERLKVNTAVQLFIGKQAVLNALNYYWSIIRESFIKNQIPTESRSGILLFTVPILTRIWDFFFDFLAFPSRGQEIQEIRVIAKFLEHIWDKKRLAT